MLHSDTPRNVEIISEGFRIWQQSTASHPQKRNFYSDGATDFSESNMEDVCWLQQHN